MFETEDEAVPQRRQLSASVTNSREARALVAAVQDKFGYWQAEAAKLEMMLARLRTAGRSDPSVGEAVRTLLGVVAHQTEMLEAEAAAAPAAIREHSRVTDVTRALALLAARLEGMLGTAGGPPPR